MSTTTEILGDRASRPCDIGDAHGVALVCGGPGLNVEYQPFRHPSLLDNEIRIRVTDSGLCQSDTFWMKNGWYQTLYPVVPGHEIIGVVTHVGEKVTKYQVGDRVGHGPMRDSCGNCSDCCMGFNNTCSSMGLTIGLHYGGWATSYQAPAKCFVEVPESISGLNAPLMCAGVTSYSPLRRDLRSGMKVGVVGIGGLGHLGIKFARSMGCEVTAISTSADKETEARELGAHHFINSKDPKQVQKAAKSLHYILDTATAYTLNTSLGMLRPNGTVTVVGAPEVSGEKNPFNAFDIVLRNLSIKGSAAGSMDDMASMIEFCDLHKINCKSEVYKFADARLAIESLGLSKPRAPRYRAVLETASFFQNFTPSN